MFKLDYEIHFSIVGEVYIEMPYFGDFVGE